MTITSQGMPVIYNNKGKYGFDNRYIETDGPVEGPSYGFVHRGLRDAGVYVREAKEVLPCGANL